MGGIIMVRKPARSIAVFCYGLFLLVSTSMPFFSFEGYSILRNTTSHLGAQGSPHAWQQTTKCFLMRV
jgi:hypothetical protein